MGTRMMALATAIAVIALVPQVGIGQQARSGYLPSGLFDITQVLPRAPQKGDAQYEADRAIFKATRHWLGTPRGDLATRDVRTDMGGMTEAFACAVGMSLTPQNAPLTLKLIAKAGVDTATQSSTAKNFFKRDRPFLIDAGPNCQPSEQLKGSYDYPSGHTTWGWTWGQILAELVPGRSTAIMARARAYGESRIVCGVHNSSAVEGGRTTASATLTAVRAQPAYQADLAAARVELERLRADPATPKPQNCTAEAALVAQPIL